MFKGLISPQNGAKRNQQLIIRSVLVVGTLGLTAATLPRVAAAFFASPPITPISSLAMERDSCPNQIVEFKNSVNWYQGKNRMTVQATSACGSKRGDSYDLSDVKLSIRSGEKIITEVHSANGTFWPKNNQILISKTDHGNEQGCLTAFELMTVDLKSGELRTPGMRKLLNSKTLVECKRGLNHV